MRLLVDQHRVLMSQWRIVDGHVIVAHGKDQHVFVSDGRPFVGQQQAEVVEHRTGVATRLIHIVGLAIDDEFHRTGIDINITGNKHGLPLFFLRIVQIGHH